MSGIFIIQITITIIIDFYVFLRLSLYNSEKLVEKERVEKERAEKEKERALKEKEIAVLKIEINEITKKFNALVPRSIIGN